MEINWIMPLCLYVVSEIERPFGAIIWFLLEFVVDMCLRVVCLWAPCVTLS